MASFSKALTPNQLLSMVKTVDGGSSGIEAETAARWSIKRLFSWAGDLVGSGQVDGSGDVVFNVEVENDSHSHTMATLPDVQSSIDETVKVSEVSARTTAGTWTITGLTIGKKVTIGVDGGLSSDTFSAVLRVISGSNIGLTNSSLRLFRLAANADADFQTLPSFELVPTSTSLSLSVSNISAGAILRAYQ